MSEHDDRRCPRCGARMAAEQDWCLECGTATTTRIMRPPGFGLPIAIVLAVVAVVAVALILAIGAVSDDANRAVPSTPASATTKSKTTPTTTTTPAKTTSTSTTSTSDTTSTTATSTTPGAAAATGADGAVPLWKKDEQAYAVIALTTSDKAEAETEARKLIGDGEDAGLLRSDDYDFFSPGAWVVWVGAYKDKSDADALNTRLETGEGGGYVTLVRAREASDSGQ